MRIAGLMVLCASCSSSQQAYSYKQAGGAETRMAPVSARVVAAREADASGLVPAMLSIPFGAEVDGTKLVQDFLAHADGRGAHLVADLAIYFQTTQDERAVECRTDIVPETVTETQTRPSRWEQVPVNRPVTRTVTEHEHRCRSVTKYESRSRTEYQQQCGSVSRPVTRTRTVYRSQYDYASKSTRSVPTTESYTAYESQYQCKSVPVYRSRMEPVTRNECRMEPVTRTVTRYEFQLESRFVPARLETITRQRLREREPACFVVELAGPPSTARTNRIEGRLFTQPRAR